MEMEIIFYYTTFQHYSFTLTFAYYRVIHLLKFVLTFLHM